MNVGINLSGQVKSPTVTFNISIIKYVIYMSLIIHREQACKKWSTDLKVYLKLKTSTAHFIGEILHS